ncbi:hypothetical protein HYV71_02065 [Candidatus Uhrbacteria bacterium]|nr:hypothetical protein [Candidatus Uhrbacteria bacterium]
MSQQALQRVIQYTDLAALRRSVPKSWSAAAGLLRYKKKALERHAVKIRKEWGLRREV